MHSWCSARIIRWDSHRCWANGDVWWSMHLHPYSRMSRHGVEVHGNPHIDFFMLLWVTCGCGGGDKLLWSLWMCSVLIWSLLKPHGPIAHQHGALEHNQHRQQEIVQLSLGSNRRGMVLWAAVVGHKCWASREAFSRHAHTSPWEN